MARIVPSERCREQLDGLIAGAGGSEDPIEEIARAGARLMLQVALEEEVSEFLGRQRYERDGEPLAHRNGCEERKVATTSGPVAVARPRIRDAEKLGFESRVCEDTRERHRRWCERSLEEHDLVYLHLDAIYLKLRPGDEPAEGVLCAWGITLEGRKVLLGLQLGSRESCACWLDFGRDLIGRGLKAPALVIADGAPGIWKAVGELWPQAKHQRCTVHALRNVLAKRPERHHAELKARWRRIFDEAASPGEAKAALLALAGEHRRAYPSAMRTIADNVEELVSHLLFPSCHRKRLRSTNLLERTFVEVRRRTKVIGRLPGETSALSFDLGGAGARLARLARGDHDPEGGGRDRADPARSKWSRGTACGGRGEGGDRRAGSRTSAELRQGEIARVVGRDPLALCRPQGYKGRAAGGGSIENCIDLRSAGQCSSRPVCGGEPVSATAARRPPPRPPLAPSRFPDSPHPARGKRESARPASPPSNPPLLFVPRKPPKDP